MPTFNTTELAAKFSTKCAAVDTAKPAAKCAAFDATKLSTKLTAKCSAIQSA